jgi:hypothetical protein
VNIFIKLGKTYITILFSKAYPDPEGIEHDYPATTFYRLAPLAISHAKSELMKFLLLYIKTGLKNPELLKLTPLE